MAEELITIGELGRRVGAPASALRYWERAGLLDVAAREGGRRRYSPDAVARVGFIRLCQDAGFGIGEIRAVLDDDPLGTGAWKTHAERKLAEVRRRIAELQAAASMLEHTLACPAPSLAECTTFTSFVSCRATGEVAAVAYAGTGGDGEE
jgi:DNA-binding transcriptional MerR regulator